MIYKSQLNRILLVLFALLSGCFSDTSQPDLDGESGLSTVNNSQQLQILHKSSYCGSVETKWLSSRETFLNYIQLSQGNSIPATPLQLPDVDFAQHGVLLVSMGQQRSGGYSIRLENENLETTANQATVYVHWQEPEPGMMVTQVITHPCIFIQVPNTGFGKIRVVDQHGKLRAEIAVE